MAVRALIGIAFKKLQYDFDMISIWERAKYFQLTSVTRSIEIIQCSAKPFSQIVCERVILGHVEFLNLNVCDNLVSYGAFPFYLFFFELELSVARIQLDWLPEPVLKTEDEIHFEVA